MASKKSGTIIPKDQEQKDTDGRTQIKVADRPTFILKTRESESRAVSPSQKNGSSKKEGETVQPSIAKAPEPKILLHPSQEMTGCMKLIDENMQLCEGALDYLQDQQDFLVVGVAGGQGVGKSTIMSLLTSNYGSDIFPAQSQSHHESGSNCTTGIDFYVTKNRVIYLDTQPILSCAVMDATASSFEQKKNSSDFGNTEYNLELQSLQFMTFLYSVCHVIIFVQDWFVDPNLVRFLQTAEMLKLPMTSKLEHDYVGYYPPIVFLHNKAQLHDFQPKTIEIMKDFYNKAFSSSGLHIHNGVDMNLSTIEGQLNLFLIPSITSGENPTFHESYKDLIKRLRSKIHGVTRYPLMPSALSEKNWYHYVSKVIEGLKKSHLSLEYARLMP
ncbi:nonsense-mediated mRNA decay factor SMG9 isoform X2 [Diachasmimorpha longicaudata]|uniref:nonsense-mediated mRNA decay factor SMG9 isoform X2 n=1 Tax=Diachasmimorpha longicaudata TaxID=58733 RepID=UPI0030B8E535